MNEILKKIEHVVRTFDLLNRKGAIILFSWMDDKPRGFVLSSTESAWEMRKLLLASIDEVLPVGAMLLSVNGTGGNASYTSHGSSNS